MRKYFFLFIIFIFILILSGCNTQYSFIRNKKNYSNKTFNKNQNTLRIEIRKIALKYLGYKGFDCSGFIFKVYQKAGINLKKYNIYSNYSSGVEFLYKIGIKYFRIKYDHPLIGDLIIFNNTYDRNKNNKFDDKFTHVALVVDLLSENTVKFIHAGSKGISIGYLNLRFKNIYKYKGRIINSYLRKKDNFYKILGKSRYLASNLFECYINIIDYYK